MQPQYYRQFFRVDKKKNGIPMKLQFNHIRRFVNFEEYESVSPFFYSTSTKVNYSRVVSTPEKLAALVDVNETVSVVSEMVKLLSFQEWVNSDFAKGMSQGDLMFSLHLVTPLAMEYKDQRVYYQVFCPFHTIMQSLKDKSQSMGLTKGLPSVFKGKGGSLVRNLQPSDGSSIAVKPFYSRNNKTVSGMIGHLEYDLNEIIAINKDARFFFGYMAYLLNFLTIGYRDMTLAFPYRADTQPLTEIKELGTVYVSIHPIEEYPLIYSI